MTPDFGSEPPDEDAGVMLPVRQWTNASAVSISTGQDIAVTPMQLITAISAMCSQGKLLKPRLLAASPAEPGRQVLAREVAGDLVEMLVKTCTEGTGVECKLEHWQARMA